MHKKLLITGIIAVAFIMTGCSYFSKAPVSKPNQVGLTEAEAKSIAEKSCIKGGESLSPGYYNENSKTWWFDANLNATKEGCNPACVVSEDSRIAEINWRCTGLIIPKGPATEKCGIENCHGMDIVCGPNVAEICTEIYMAGDNCRQYASCQTVGGQCVLEKTPKFDSCKSCVERCGADHKDDQIGFFQCESKCTE